MLTDAMAPVHQFIDGFNKGDLKAAIAACADEASVIDDFPPHEWQGTGCRKWADDFDALTKKEGITDARMVLGKPLHVDVTDDRSPGGRGRICRRRLHTEVLKIGPQLFAQADHCEWLR